MQCNLFQLWSLTICIFFAENENGLIQISEKLDKLKLAYFFHLKEYHNVNMGSHITQFALKIIQFMIQAIVYVFSFRKYKYEEFQWMEAFLA